MPFRIDAGGTEQYCDGVSRRSFVQLGVAGLATLGLGDILRAKELSAPWASATNKTDSKKSVILIWLDGGPSHLDMYDMKPEAAAEVRGIWKPIRTNVPGIEISELFPKQAHVADKFAIVRSLAHHTGDHFGGGHRMLTGKDLGVNGARQSQKFPSIGSIVARQKGPNRHGMPAYVAVPYAASIGLMPGYFGGSWLGAEYDPFATGGDPNAKTFRVENLALTRGLTIDRLNDRRSADATPRPGAADARRPRPLRHARQVRRRRLRVRQRQAGPHRLRHQPRERQAPRRLRPQLVGPVDPVGTPPRRGGSDVRDGALGRLGPSLEFEVRNGARPADGRLAPVEPCSPI